MIKRVKLPTAPEIAELPLWARVAFAARCGRRVQEIFEAWAGDNEPYRKAADKALRMAEAAADKSTPTEYNTSEMDPVVTAARKSRSGYYAARAIVAAAESAGDSRGVEGATKAAFDSLKAIRDDVRDETKDNDAAREAEAQAKEQIREDFDFLMAQAKERKWDDNSRVPWTLFQSKSIWPKYRAPE